MVQDIPSKADSHSDCQKIACFHYGARRFITVFTKAHYRTLSWASWIQFAPSIPISLRSILMLSSHISVSLHSGLFASDLPTNTLQTSLPSPIRATSPAHLFLLHLITLTKLFKKYTLWRSSLCNFLYDSSSSLSGPNILLNTMFSKTLILCSYFKVRDQVSHV
jgi:hypothetical protein